MAGAGTPKRRRFPGFVCIDPTDLTLDFPHGGTQLGAVADVEFQVRPVRGEIRAEEFGGQLVEMIENTERPLLAAFLRGYDNDVVSTLFRETSVGAGTGATGIVYPGTSRSGSLATDRAVTVLFSPKDTEAHPAIILYRALPLLDVQARLRMSVREEYGFPVAFEGIRDGTGRIYAKQLLEDLVL